MEPRDGNFSDSIAGITIDSKGFVYVIERLQSRIQKFDTSLGKLNKPEDIAINDKTGEILVTDTKNCRIQELQLK